MGRFKTHEERARKRQYRREALKNKEREDLVLAKEMKQNMSKTKAKRPSVVQFRLPNKIG